MTDSTGVQSKENSPDHSYRAGGLDAPETGPVAGHSSVERWRGTGVRALVRLGWQETKQLWNGRAPLHDIERRSVISRLFPQGVSRRQFFTRFASLMMLSTAIATFGILADSTAVVIGAMLVTVGATLAVLLAAVISFVVPGHTDPLPAELMARTSPNLLDLGIALAAGAAGAYGQVKRHAAEALTGVAVAVALVPPLAVVGITLQLTEWQLAHGALLLFLANVVGIIIAAAATFLAAGFVPGRNPLRGRPQIVRGVSWAAIAAIIVVLPMQFGRGNVLPLSDPTDEVTIFVEEYVAERESSSEVANVAVEVDGGVTEVDVVIASSFAPPSVNALAQRHPLTFGVWRPIPQHIAVLDARRLRSVLGGDFAFVVTEPSGKPLLEAW